MSALRSARPGDVQPIWRVMQAAHAALSDRSLYLIDDPAFIADCVARGWAYVACEGGEVVAFLLIRQPGNDPQNLGHHIHLSSEDLARVTMMDSVAVLPEWRGHGLQRKLLTCAEERLRPDMKYLMATVSPDNAYSAANFRALGYRVACTVPKYDGLLRDVWLKVRD